jgi:hypothetical protein
MRKLGSRLRNLFAKAARRPGDQPRISAETLRQRIERVAESILDNERLTADLDDSAAKELLDWGLSVAREIVQGTADVDDDEQAEQAMYPRLRATRRLMRAVNAWIANQREGDAENRDKAFDSILEQASVIYGRSFDALDDEQRAALASRHSEFADDPPHMIAHLRELFEHPDDIPNT